MDKIELVDSSEFYKPKPVIKPTEEPKSEAPTLTSSYAYLRFPIYFIIWFFLLKYAYEYHLGHMFVFLTGLFLILTNLGTRKKGEMSAYSVFNDGFKKLMGTMDANQVDPRVKARARGERENGYVGLNDDDDDDSDNQKPTQTTQLNKISKMSNQPCYCGSGKKFKKCCYWAELKQRQTPKPINNNH